MLVISACLACRKTRLCKEIALHIFALDSPQYCLSGNPLVDVQRYRLHFKMALLAFTCPLQPRVWRFKSTSQFSRLFPRQSCACCFLQQRSVAVDPFVKLQRGRTMRVVRKPNFWLFDHSFAGRTPRRRQILAACFGVFELSDRGSFRHRGVMLTGPIFVG